MSVAASIKTACPYCGVGCGLIAAKRPHGVPALSADPDHPANFGRLCSKGSALSETLDLDGRLLRPVIDGAETSWDRALDETAARLNSIIAEHGPDSVALYVSGQLLTEDYYVANKLMKGFIGSGNIDTNSRLCMASSVVGHQRAFGEDIVPGNYEDLEEADLIVLVGSNTAWCHPVLYQRLRVKSGRDAKIVVIDPRRTSTCERADLHLAVKSGTDAVLFNGVLADLSRRGKLDTSFIENHTEGFAEALTAAQASAPDAATVARICGLAETDVARFFDWFSGTRKTVTLYSQGINQSSSGTDKVNAIINCHLATGRIGKLGMGPFSLTGQPNAMGGREVGGLATQLAAHLRFDNPADRDLVGRFWKTQHLAEKPGLKAVDLFNAIEAGNVKAVWIMATNPMVSLPDAGRARAALKKCELVVVSDCMAKTDTTAFADILLPASAWGEKDGTVTNSERRISRQRAFLPIPGDAKPDWWIICNVARRMGFGSEFAFESPAAIFREHAALSGFENNGRRAFDISGLAAITDGEYEALAPVQWPVLSGQRQGTARLLGNGKFFTANGKGQFLAIAPRAPVHMPSADYPFALNTGRTRDHWHTMTRTGKSARLSAHASEPAVEINPRDADSLGIADGKLTRVATRWGDVIARARVTDNQRPGSLFVPMHWNGQFASSGLVNASVNPEIDPASGQPELKHTPARVTAIDYAWQGFALSRRALAKSDADYWVQIRCAGYWRYDLAGFSSPADWTSWAQEILGKPGRVKDRIEFADSAAGDYRCARFRDGRLESYLFVSKDAPKISKTWLAEMFAKPRLNAAERVELLSGKTGGDGETVCSCFGIGSGKICDAVANGARSVDDIGKVLRAGTSCGSCRPEIDNLIQKSLGKSDDARRNAVKRAS